MALLTPLDLKTAQSLARSFGIFIRDVQALSAGSVNSNFRLIDSAGIPYFARLYEEQGPAGAAAEVQLLAELAEAGAKVVLPLGCSELPLYEGKPFAVFPFIDGEILCQKQVTERSCDRVGQALAELHGATSKLTKLPLGRFNPRDLHARLDFIEGEATAELARSAKEIRGALDYYTSVRETRLPQGIIHSDLFRDNVLWQSGQIRALIDFESASVGYFAYDLMVTMLAWCFSDHFEPKLVRSLLAGYQAVRPLTELEIENLPTEAALGCLRFAITRITDFSMRTPPSTAPRRHFGRFLERLNEIERGALRREFERLSG